MEFTLVSAFVDILLIVAFIVDRIFRLKSIKEYKDAKEAQIENLKQQLEIEKTNNDVVITEMHKKRNENLKIILEEKESEIEYYKNVLLEIQSLLENTNKELTLKAQLAETLSKELERVKNYKIALETEKKTLSIAIPDFTEYPEQLSFRRSNRQSFEDDKRHER